MDNSKIDVEIQNKLNEENANDANPLDIVFADSLISNFQIPDELIQDVLLKNSLSVIYGDSNCGKTFLAIDMACSIARGVPWMGKQVEQGMIVYLASEAPKSVEMRLHTYQKYFEVVVPDFVIVRNSLNLFDTDADMIKVLQLIKNLEHQYNKKVSLVVGDTLASISAGANESSGEDMGRIINRAGEIRNEGKTHVSLIHHSGKNPAAGARGWSGLRAAVDTEIEVTETALGKCAELKKLRDIGQKGERLGFRLIPTVIGISKWKKPITSCVVQSIDAPVKQQKALPEVAGAILGFLSAQIEPVRYSVLIDKLTKKYSTSGLKAQLKKLKESGKILNNDGYYELFKG